MFELDFVRDLFDFALLLSQHVCHGVVRWDHSSVEL